MCARSEYTPLDKIDRQILQLLQRDARNATAVEIAERVDVSDGTVRNRIENLEEQGVIEGYAPIVNYEQAGYQLQISIKCTAPILEREQMAREALQIEGVVSVSELMTGRRNIEVVAVAPHHEDISSIAYSLSEIGLEIVNEELVRHQFFRPFNHFGAGDVTSEWDDAHTF